MGIVTPADARPGEEVSGSLVLDPKNYQGVPGLRVTTVELPLDRDDNGQPSLRGVVVDTGDGQPQQADQAMKLKLPSHLRDEVDAVRLLFHRQDQTTSQVSAVIPGGPVTMMEGEVASTGSAGDFSAPPVASSGTVQLVHGPFDGNSATTEVHVDGTPAHVLAETPRACYYKLPPGLSPGAHKVTLKKGSHSVSFNIYVIRLEMSAERLQLMRGETTDFHATLRGADQIPADIWSAGEEPALLDLSKLSATAPGYHPPAMGKVGQILIAISNASPQTVTLEGSKNETVTLA
ncbi:MAG: hypothetical protein ACRD5L_04430, partial [Bryobacteraceae bacterium]